MNSRPRSRDYAAVRAAVGASWSLILEPGRSIVANAGVLLTRVHYLKETPSAHNFALVDAAMNDFIRPALYEAWVDIQPASRSAVAPRRWDVVGPVCETADFLGKDRELALETGSLLAVHGAGAYGFTMSSNYNSRPRAAEIMVDGDQLPPGARARDLARTCCAANIACRMQQSNTHANHHNGTIT
jgi:diaminopimelate decarboxylase